MRAVGAGHLRCAYSLDELLTVVCELVNGVHVIIEDPDVLFRIVRVDRNEVRALQNCVPLRPAFDDVSIGVGDHDAVLPFRVDAEFAVPAVGWSAGNLAGPAGSWKRRDCGVTPG